MYCEVTNMNNSFVNISASVSKDLKNCSAQVKPTLYLSNFLWNCFEHQSHNDKPKQLKWIVVNITVSLTNAPDKCQECTASLLHCFDFSVYFLRGHYGLERVLHIICIAAYILFIQQTLFPTRMCHIQKHTFFLCSLETINFNVFMELNKGKK